ncbi:efflux transporter outer membrane subunit [Duganella sp. FT92W]|uniref:Efflux transporter outer membrane subunit n=1 Tax=Pseudoduganella rivuli TaxID=2666085 RepID=A0A7X2IJW8_9BURK|nr:efflux transporter outer membrane subunit [Pseudoduganella rivuli]MRV71186.1 efflux transporter outer membrane subunit [Pseudoduganella rivuli]
MKVATTVVMTAWLAATALLAGCAAKAPPPPPSALHVPDTWRSTPAAGAPATDVLWWQAYGDPALSALVGAALEHNGDVRIARARVAEYRARVALAHSAQQPTAGYDAAPARARALTATGAPRTANVFVAEFQAAYEIDWWGRLQQQTDAARASYQAEQAGLDVARLSVAATVAAGYLNLRGLDAQLELAQATLAIRERSRALARRQFEVGYSSKLEWLQAQSEYLAASEQVPQLQRQVCEQENALAVLAGGNPGPIARGIALADLAPPQVGAGLPSDLLQRRPDLARAARNAQAASAQLAATRDQLLPSFRLTVQGGLQSSTLHALLADPTHLWKLAGIVAGPVTDGGRVQAQTEAAAFQRDQALIAYENTARAAFAETDNALGAIARLREQLAVNEERRAQAAETLRIARNRYRNGYASYLEELDAQRTLYAADVARLQLKARLLVATVDLYRALGGGWGT